MSAPTDAALETGIAKGGAALADSGIGNNLEAAGLPVNIASQLKMSSSASISKEVRRFLTDARAFIQGSALSGEFLSYGLEQAIHDRLGEIDGTPRNPAKLNMTDRLDLLLSQSTLVLTAASSLSEDDLGTELVSGLTSGIGGVGGAIQKGLSVLEEGPGALNGDYIPGEVGGKLGEYGEMSSADIMSQATDGVPLAKDAQQLAGDPKQGILDKGSVLLT